MSTSNWESEQRDRSSNISDLVETFKHAKCPVVKRIQAQIRKAERRNQIYTNILLAYTQPNRDCMRRMSCSTLSGLIFVLLIITLYIGIQIGVKMARPRPLPSLYNSLFDFSPHRF